MPKALREILDGNIGYFWPQYDTSIELESGQERGALELDPAGHLAIRTLDEDPVSRLAHQVEGREPRRPLALVGQLEDGGVLVLDVSGSGTSTRIGGARASVNRYRARVAVGRVSLAALRSSNLLSITLFMPGITTWVGNDTVTVQSELGDDGRHRGVSLSVRSPEPIFFDIGSGQRLELGMHWHVGGPGDRRTIYAPYFFRVRSDAPVEATDLLAPLLALQDLLNTAFQGFMKADGGQATADTESKPSPAPEFWSSQAMLLPLGAEEPRSRTEVPLFTLATIGGAVALPKWIELATTHPRLIEPVVDRFRFGHPTAATYLRDVGAGIEYWKAVNARVRDWADERLQPLAVAQSVGQPFQDWLGVPVRDWADRFWGAYNASKHYISQSEARAEDASTLALSGSVLLTAVALQEISGVNWTVENLLESHRLQGLRERLRGLFVDNQ